jgi:formylglycine-generating enzyme required for sulfatase activity
LKPSNILVEPRGDGKMVLRITDFGIGGLAAQPVLERSRSTSLQDNMASVLTGSYSPLYASPQQMRGDKPDPRDDVFAIGVIWYQLLTGDLTAPAPTGLRWAEALRQKGMSDEALHLLSSCFESNPDHRPSDAGGLAALLEALPRSVPAKTAGTPTELPLIEPPSATALLPRESEAPSEPLARRGKPIREAVVGRGFPDPAPLPDRRSPGPAPAQPSAAADRPPRTATQPQPALTRADGSQRSSSRLKLITALLASAALLGITLYITTDNGTVKITGTDDRMKISIDGDAVTIENLGKPIMFRTGLHKFTVKRDGMEFKSDSFQIKRGEETVLDVTYIPPRPPEPEPEPNKREPPAPAESPPAHPEDKATVSVPPAKSAPPAPAQELTTRTGQIRLRLIPAGDFMMGSPESQGDSDEHPQHKVRITRPFYLGVTEVTRGQFRLFVDETNYKTEAEKDGKGGYGWNEEAKKFEQHPKYTWQNPGFEHTDEHPVVNVSWNDTQDFIAWLSRKEGKAFRLPTEAEWEYACRGGAKTAYFSGDDAETLTAFGNIANGTAKEKYPDWTTISGRDGYVYTAPVGRFSANAFGLYDMHGNVLEWCRDGYDAAYSKQSPTDDPAGSPGTSLRVYRGGSWSRIPGRCRSAYRSATEPSILHLDLGFRVALGQSGG